LDQVMKKIDTMKDVGSDGEEGGDTGAPQWQKCGKLERKYKKYGLKKMERYVKEKENAGKIKNRMETCNQNKVKLMKTDGESNGEKGGDKRAPKRMGCESLKLNTDSINNSIYSCTKVVKLKIRRNQVMETKSKR